MSLRSTYTQWFPPSPTFTEETIPPQTGKIFIVTGGSSGIGLALIKILYGKGATVYMAARSRPKALAAINTIQSSHPSAKQPLARSNTSTSTSTTSPPSKPPPQPSRRKTPASTSSGTTPASHVPWEIAP